MRSGSYMHLSATVKKPPFNIRTPPAQVNAMPTFPRHSASLSPPASTATALSSPDGRFSSAVGHRRGVRGGGTTRRRLLCSRKLLDPRTLIVASLFSLFLVAYWTSYLTSTSFGLDSVLKMRQRHNEQSRPTEIDLNQILFTADLHQFSRTKHTAVYVLCDDDDAFTYLNYLSIASAMRFYNPDQLIILYETRPPSVTGDWVLSSSWLSSSSDQFAALMSRCHRRYQGPMKMKNGTMVCRSRRRKQPTAGSNVEQSDGGKFFYEFITRLLLQYGGLYVGHRTFMTEVATYFRLEGAVNEHMLSYHSHVEHGEGFIFVREPVVDRPPTSPQPNAGALFSPAPGAMAAVATTHRPNEAPPGAEIRYYTSREIGCYEGRNFSIDALQMTADQKVSLYACVVMCDGTPASRPFEVLALKSDFGRSARKAVFNIHDDWETKYYLKAVNGSAVPPLCYF